MRSGFCSIVGRPNVGKSTLVNRICGTKVSIVSDKVQTTRTQVRGVLTLQTPADWTDAQVVFVDTPGVLKPRTLLGERTNAAATAAMSDVDLTCLLIDATMPFGKGDKFIAQKLPKSSFLIVNKVDLASRQQVLRQLQAASELGFEEYFPISAADGTGIRPLVEAIIGRFPEGPMYYPLDMVSDVDETFWVAELVREQLLAITEEELPHSIACRVVDWEDRAEKGPYVRIEILVERESQKPIVIGKGGTVLKQVGSAVRQQLPAGAYVELFVKVAKDWQRTPYLLDRLGYRTPDSD
jgi:GTPase